MRLAGVWYGLRSADVCLPACKTVSLDEPLVPEETAGILDTLTSGLRLYPTVSPAYATLGSITLTLCTCECPARCMSTLG